jgi:voltage-gated potassium channel
MDRLRKRLGLEPRFTSSYARHEVARFLERVVLLIAALNGLVLAGALALSLFEDVSYWQGLQWSIDTIATVGSIPAPQDLGGQITKLVLITLGLGTMFYVLVTLTELLVAGDLSGLLEARRMQRKIEHLNDHFLICGFGRVGSQVARDLREAGAPFVVIDDNPEVREALVEAQVLHIDGRPSDDQALIEAGIERARALIACIDSDAENIFATLTARQLRPDIEIVARAAEESSEPKLLAAGANDVVSPYKTSGRAMAQLALDSQRGRQAGEQGKDAPGREVTIATEATSPFRRARER